MPGCPIRLSSSEAVTTPPPLAGQHTDEVLARGARALAGGGGGPAGARRRLSTPAPAGPSVRSVVVLSLPAAAAVAVFGTLYGAAASVFLGAPLTLASSLLVYSGALQFAMVALLGAGATTLPLLLTTVVLNLRHLVLGAALRSRFESGPLRRALLAFFLVDETFGFAIAAGNAVPPGAVGAATERTLLVSGLTLYVAWIVGTVVGVLGGVLAAVEGLAGALFPVLFIGLAALAATRRSHVVRALAAAVPHRRSGRPAAGPAHDRAGRGGRCWWHCREATGEPRSSWWRSR